LHRQAIPFLHEPKANIGLAAARAPMTNGGRDERRQAFKNDGQRPEVNLATGERDLRAALAPWLDRLTEAFRQEGQDTP
jgi:hypothetical protein